MNKNKIKKIATWIIVPLMMAIFILDIATVVLSNKYARKFYPEDETFTYEFGDDRIHFLNTANSDAIIIESNGRFAMIDAGEGNSNPRRKTDYKGYEKEVIDYIKKICKTENGDVSLEFILGTHCHYDHIGCYKAVISDKEIGIGKAYFKEFRPEIAKEYEIKDWKIDEVYNEIINSLSSRNISVINEIPLEMSFGDFELEFFNTVTPDELKGEGENASSIGIKVIKGNKSAFLAADITKSCGLEQLLGEKIGDIDLLKLGHHGYFGSSSRAFLDCLKPEMAVVTNQLGKIYPNVKWNLIMHAALPVYSTYDNNGVIASFTEDGEIILTKNIH